MPAPVVAVGAVARDARRRLLVVRRGREPGRGRWTLPGGRLEAGERLAAAVRREVLEETGLAVAVGDLIGVFESLAPDHHLVVLDYAVRVEGGSLRAGGDAAAAAFMGRGKLRRAGPTPGLLDFLAERGVGIAP